MQPDPKQVSELAKQFLGRLTRSSRTTPTDWAAIDALTQPDQRGGDANTRRSETPNEPVMTERGAGESGSPQVTQPGPGAHEKRLKEISGWHADAHNRLDKRGIPRFAEKKNHDGRLVELTLEQRIDRLIGRLRAEWQAEAYDADGPDEQSTDQPQPESGSEVTEGLPPELAAASLRIRACSSWMGQGQARPTDRSVAIEADERIFQKISEWRDAPSNTVSADPVHPQPRSGSGEEGGDRDDVLRAIIETWRECLREPNTEWKAALWDRLSPGEPLVDALAALSQRETLAEPTPTQPLQGSEVERVAQVISGHLISDAEENQPDFCKQVARDVLACLAEGHRDDGRRWKLWRIEHPGGEDWIGCSGPATNPPDDLSGDAWIEAAKVEVMPAADHTALQAQLQRVEEERDKAREQTEAMAWAAGWETDGCPPFEFETVRKQIIERGHEDSQDYADALERATKAEALIDQAAKDFEDWAREEESLIPGAKKKRHREMHRIAALTAKRCAEHLRSQSSSEVGEGCGGNDIAECCGKAHETGDCCGEPVPMPCPGCPDCKQEERR